MRRYRSRRQRVGRCWRCKSKGPVYAWYVSPVGPTTVSAWLCDECLGLARAVRSAGGRYAREQAHRGPVRGDGGQGSPDAPGVYGEALSLS